ncbi:DUF4406 domain-containing protein [Escherichia coli]|nr:DUF4406 domain-containing protein [Escherichia coli]
MRVRVYIAGPMTGYENFNREAFHKVEEELKREGHTVLNPAVLPDGCNQVNHLIPTRVLVKGGEITCKILK